MSPKRQMTPEEYQAIARAITVGVWDGKRLIADGPFAENHESALIFSGGLMRCKISSRNFENKKPCKALTLQGLSFIS